MRVAIVGAGVTGLVNARVLRGLGVEVVVFEKRPDVGGVWSATRGYPGLRIQNDKRSYALSDFPMPAHYPEHPSRAELQAYLESYSRRHRLDEVVRLSTTVERATYDPSMQSWAISVHGPDGAVQETVDWLILANGTLSTPNTPVFEGVQEFERAGGRVVEPGQLGDEVDFGGRRISILGYGKSATDIAVAAASRALDVSVIARSAPWKLPPRIGPVPFQNVVISRVGEHLLWAPHRTPLGLLLKRLDVVARWAYRAALAARLRAQLELHDRGLVPRTSLQDVSHLVTPGFDRAVDAGLIRLHVGDGIATLGTADGHPAVFLDDGSVLHTDLLVTATGYRTDTAFLDRTTQELLHDGDGRMPLWRHTVPERAPRLLFAGWINSFRSPIASELQAMWIAAFLHGAVKPQVHHADLQGRRGVVDAAPTGLSIIEQDGWLRDIGLAMPWRVVAAELFRPLDPAAYGELHVRLRDLLGERATTPFGVDRPDPLPQVVVAASLEEGGPADVPDVERAAGTATRG